MPRHHPLALPPLRLAPPWRLALRRAHLCEDVLAHFSALEDRQQRSAHGYLFAQAAASPDGSQIEAQRNDSHEP